MKHLLLLAALLPLLMACSPTTPEKKNEQATLRDGVEVLYFHGKKRCVTCNAIENLTREVLESEFAEALKNGQIIYKVIDISLPENAEIADKYEVSWSSLFVLSVKDGVESPQNLTELGFAKAKTQPDAFKAEVTHVLRQLLP